MKKTKTYALLLIVVLVSFAGFWVENIFIAFMGGFMNNRNMKLPFLLGYGLAILTIYRLFGTPKKPLFWGRELSLNRRFSGTIYYFFIAFLCVCIAEIIIGYTVEWTCGIIWWNYSNIPLHITRYTSVPTSLGFAFLITLFMRFAFLPLLNLFQKVPDCKTYQ